MNTQSHPLHIARIFVFVAILVFAFVLTARAQSDYYRHIIFDNCPTKETCFYTRAYSNGPSFIEQQNSRLPVETEHFLTPPNAIRIQWQSAPEGGWNAQISLLDFRNRRPGLDGHNLYFWLYAPQPIAAADLPKLVLSTSPEGLQVAEFPASFSAPISLGKYTGDLPAARWVEVRIPFAGLQTASIYPFNPAYIQSLTLHQDRADNIRHTLIVDEIRVADEPASNHALAAPANLRATGYDRHIELEWNSADPADLAHYVVYRSTDNGPFKPIGIQLPGFHRYEDFLGKSGVQARYKIAATDWANHESPQSNDAAAATREFTDDELLTMMQHACFR